MDEWVGIEWQPGSFADGRSLAQAASDGAACHTGWSSGMSDIAVAAISARINAVIGVLSTPTPGRP